MARRLALLVSCEHAGRAVPAPYRRLFAGREGVLGTHRAWDPGALELARALARPLAAPLLSTTVTRLLVDTNRSPGRRGLFSVYSRPLTAEERSRLLSRHYLPHRRAVEEAAGRIVRGGDLCLHLSVHSFTPVLRGKRRRADLGLLYDPRREGERVFCRRLKGALRASLPSLRVRLNYPYRGAADGLTTHLRRLYGESDYLGVELEANQLIRHRRGKWSAVKGVLRASLRDLLPEP